MFHLFRFRSELILSPFAKRKWTSQRSLATVLVSIALAFSASISSVPITTTVYGRNHLYSGTTRSAVVSVRILSRLLTSITREHLESSRLEQSGPCINNLYRDELSPHVVLFTSVVWSIDSFFIVWFRNSSSVRFPSLNVKSRSSEKWSSPKVFWRAVPPLKTQQLWTLERFYCFRDSMTWNLNSWATIID